MMNDREKKKSVLQTSRFRKCTLECEGSLVIDRRHEDLIPGKEYQIKSDSDGVREGKT